MISTLIRKNNYAKYRSLNLKSSQINTWHPHTALQRVVSMMLYGNTVHKQVRMTS